eukprot:2340282-Pleurochrysis_carterae.AAC.2
MRTRACDPRLAMRATQTLSLWFWRCATTCARDRLTRACKVFSTRPGQSSYTSACPRTTGTSGRRQLSGAFARAVRKGESGPFP